MAFVTERPLFFALHTHGLFEGNIAPSNTVRSWKIWPFIFTPYISPKPLFLPKIVTQSPIFFTLSRILEIFHSKTPNRLEFEKKVPKCSLFLWLLSLKDPYFLPCIHMVCLRGMLLPHTQSEAGKFDPLFSPPTSAPNPCFYQKLSPKVLFFSHCPEFWKFFTQRPLIGWNLRKRYPNVPYFYGFCHWKTPYFLPCIHMVCLRGMLLPHTRSEAGKFRILETEWCNLVNTFRCKFNRGDENKISVLQAQPTQLCIMDEFHWRAGMIYRLLSP